MHHFELPRPPWVRVGILLVCTLLGGAEQSRAQSIGLEVGWAGVENYDPLEVAFGAAFFYPFAERLTASLSYTQWTGEDGNAAAGAGDPDFVDSRFIGNRALNALLYYRVAQSDRLAWSLGAGLGQFERWRSVGGDRVSEYQGALTMGTRLSYWLVDRFGVYVRADVGAPSFHILPIWALVRTGIAWRP